MVQIGTMLKTWRSASVWFNPAVSLCTLLKPWFGMFLKLDCVASFTSGRATLERTESERALEALAATATST